jgi:ABC-2 type transport system ATP-binding protein
MGKTILISSHILSELSEMCTGIGIMNRGRLVTAGKMENVMTQVFGGNRIAVSVEGEIEPAVHLLKEQAGIRVESVGEKEIQLTHTLEDAAFAQVIAQMIGQGIVVTGFQKQAGNLETLFMQLTGGQEHADKSNC